MKTGTRRQNIHMTVSVVFFPLTSVSLRGTGEISCHETVKLPNKSLSFRSITTGPILSACHRTKSCLTSTEGNQ
ncbi:hypothetical protein DPEC_G00291110 [Dallia pectoralis]|uniref:Uncharacterized protein n=1 Tax=Dallia pectoralis TaxID=75939 RepID=A0ACC2FHR4_DALPE|nr:hypothetical protein DPEC_G00291110 [Dallia pectoralis]